MIEITTYRPELEEAFIRLNTEWIERYFRIEESDVYTFTHVRDYVLRDGGEIFFALLDGEPVGCVALIHHAADNPLGEWELAKMAVSQRAQGKGAGNLLLEALTKEGDRRGIADIYIEGNTRLEASLHLYKKYGFREIPVDETRYERVDIMLRRTNNQN